MRLRLSSSLTLLVLTSLALACGSDEPPIGDAGLLEGGFAPGVDGSLPGADGAIVTPEGGSVDGSTDGTTPGGGCGAVSEQAELKLQPTDVVWAIDTSGSMTASFPAIQQALVDFSDRVSGAGIDAHIILLAGATLCVPAPLGSGNCGGLGGVAADSREPALLHLDLPFGSSMGIPTILDNHGAYAHLLRPEARTHLVVTEDGAPTQSAQAVVDHLEGRASATFSPAWDPPLTPGNWVFHGVVCENGVGAAPCNIPFLVTVPQTTLDLIDRTGGLVANLEDAGDGSGGDPFAALLEALAEQVVVGAELSCEFPIPAPPSGETLDPGKVNVVLVDDEGNQNRIGKVSDGGACGSSVAWDYDDPANPSEVVLCPAACDAARAQIQARVDVQFGCETVTLN